LLLFAITDNPIIYTAQFMAPMAVIFGLSDRMLSRARQPRALLGNGGHGQATLTLSRLRHR
jgi:hypothetical protein